MTRKRNYFAAVVLFLFQIDPNPFPNRPDRLFPPYPRQQWVIEYEPLELGGWLGGGGLPFVN